MKKWSIIVSVICILAVVFIINFFVSQYLILNKLNSCDIQSMDIFELTGLKNAEREVSCNDICSKGNSKCINALYTVQTEMLGENARWSSIRVDTQANHESISNTELVECNEVKKLGTYMEGDFVDPFYLADLKGDKFAKIIKTNSLDCICC